MIPRAGGDGVESVADQVARMRTWGPTIEAAARIPIRSRAVAETLIALANRYREAMEFWDIDEADQVVRELAFVVAQASGEYEAQGSGP